MKLETNEIWTLLDMVEAALEEMEQEEATGSEEYAVCEKLSKALQGKKAIWIMEAAW